MIISEVAGHTAYGKVAEEESDLLKVTVNFDGYEENSIPYGIAGDKYSYRFFKAWRIAFSTDLSRSRR